MRNDSRILFSEVFGRVPQITVNVCGRINLIGEHIDYNGGHVLPVPISRGISCCAARRSDSVLRLFSDSPDHGGIAEISLDSIDSARPLHQWQDYPVGMIKALKECGYSFSGADMLFCSDLPVGAGLSSSAALETASGRALCGLYGKEIPDKTLALCGQKAENSFIGVNCGIMDQFTCAAGRTGCAVLLDTVTLSHRYVPLPLDKADIVIIDSRVKHSLAGSEYNRRRAECETALRDIRTAAEIKNLCSLTPELYVKLSSFISDPVCRKRAEHAVYENHRTLRAADALESGDLNTFGELMNASHASLRDLFEVSCGELDFLAETAWKQTGVFGSRMTGGGFGGCTVTLVGKKYTQRFIENMKREYLSAFGLEAGVILV